MLYRRKRDALKKYTYVYQVTSPECICLFKMLLCQSRKHFYAKMYLETEYWVLLWEEKVQAGREI